MFIFQLTSDSKHIIQLEEERDLARKDVRNKYLMIFRGRWFVCKCLLEKSFFGVRIWYQWSFVKFNVSCCVTYQSLQILKAILEKNDAHFEIWMLPVVVFPVPWALIAPIVSHWSFSNHSEHDVNILSMISFPNLLSCTNPCVDHDVIHHRLGLIKTCSHTLCFPPSKMTELLTPSQDPGARVF